MKPTLLVLAAGMGSRYGGLKQMDGLGPGGETIIDYSIYDAVQAGFGRVVYIVREYFLDAIKEAVARKYSHVTCTDGTPLEFVFVTQELDKIPARFLPVNTERQKPWGTAHAVQMAAEVIREPFVVINGDDFYGRESFRIAGDWCRAHRDSRDVYAIVGFELDHTLSESGGVSRGICHYDASNQLTDVVEHLNIIQGPDGVVRGDNSATGERVVLRGSDLCSMNMWCFTPDYFTKSAAIFETFLEQNALELKKEYYIPYAIDCMVRDGSTRCDVLSTPSRWFGVTYKEDRPAVVAKFAQLAREGVYPTPLYR